MITIARCDLPAPDVIAADAVRSRAARVLRPSGAFARLDELAAWLAGWQRTATPRVTRPACLVFAGDHGLTRHGVSAYPASVTAEMVGALRDGVATASVLARSVGAHLEVVDVGVGRPTGDITVEPALTPDQALESWRAGRAAVDRVDADLLVVGELGIGNTTAAAAVAASLFGGPAARWVGPGTGVDGAALARKVAVVGAACARVPDEAPIEVLRHCGGSELVAIAGAVVRARERSLAVVLDGFVTAAAAAAVSESCAGAVDHCVAGHLSPEPGHRQLLDRLGMAPLLDLSLRLGEGSGALLAVPLLRMAAAAVTDVATFEEWGLG